MNPALERLDRVPRRRLLAAASGLLAAPAVLGAGRAAAAEAPHLRLAVQFGIIYLPLMVMQERRLIEAAAKAAGLPVPRVSWLRFSGGAAMNDAVLSGSLDFGAAGIPPILTAWDRTRTSLAVKAVASLASVPSDLVANRPGMRTVRDFTRRDRIALPAVEVSLQAIVLRMAAAKAFGPSHFAQLDPLTISLSHPDATTALIDGHAGVTAHFSNPPFQEQELSHPGIHTVLSSFDVLGGSHSSAMLYATSRFRNANPHWVAAVIAALRSADALIAADPRTAAEIYVRSARSSLGVDFLAGLLRTPGFLYTTTPQNVMTFARFQHGTGQLRNLPASWKDVFFPELTTGPDAAAGH